MMRSVAVSAAFLPQNALVVYTDGRTEDSRMKLNAAPEHYLRGRLKDDYMRRLPSEVKTVPMVVLVLASINRTGSREAKSFSLCRLPRCSPV